MDWAIPVTVFWDRSQLPAHIFLQIIVETSANFIGDRILDPEPRGNLEIQI
jgi:hypothetical protein